MDHLWKDRPKPNPLDWHSLPDAVAGSSSQEIPAIRDQQIWSIKQCATIFEKCLKNIKNKMTSLTEGEHLTWDKDDDDCMDFVAACANIRDCFHIAQNSRFTIKSMAGNIIPAIASTNAIVAGLIVLNALKIVRGESNCCRTLYLSRKPNSTKKLIVPCVIDKPNPKCYVCSPKSEILLAVNVEKMTVKMLEEKILKRELSMVAPDVEVEDGKGTILASVPPPPSNHNQRGPPRKAPQYQAPRKRGEEKRTERSLQFREKNAEFMNQLTKELEAKLFIGAPSVLVAAEKQTPVEYAVPVPISTRGVGLACNAVAQRLQGLLTPVRYAAFNVDALYRVSMAQLHYKLERVCSKGHSFRSHVPVIQPMDYPTELLLRENRRTFKPIADIINMIGTVVFEGGTYVPYVPDAPIENPLFMTFPRLRPAVVAMHDFETPAPQRQAYHEFSPLPGGLWLQVMQPVVEGIPPQPVIPAQVHLSNPDNVMSAHYGVTQLVQDINALGVFMDQLKTKYPLLLGDVDWDAPGSPGLLASYEARVEMLVPLNRPNVLVPSEPYLGITDINSKMRLTSVQLASGLLALTGEMDPLVNHFRDSREALVELPLSWSNMEKFKEDIEFDLEGNAEDMKPQADVPVDDNQEKSSTKDKLKRLSENVEHIQAKKPKLAPEEFNQEKIKFLCR
ncbi:UBA2 [Cordylochernes scorpioides]|uniref:UBA2 n=1 Tax=Cordylochernes scorpioides TaxID=51811 RepID=A0ABY6LWH4_9ARAC|nr:UBA2 [Cordylochernes scorpioides]